MTQRSLLLLRGLIALIGLIFIGLAIVYAILGEWNIATFWIVCGAWFDLHAHIRRMITGS